MKSELKKLKGESDNHFIWRVYKYRDDTGKISQQEAGEICNRELGVNYHESRHRRKYQNFVSMWNDIRHEYIDEESLLGRIDEVEKKEEIYKLKVQNSDALREYRTLLRDDARIKTIKECISDLADSMDIYSFPTKPVVDDTYVDWGILQISDWHMGEVFKNYWGEYNQDILKQRVDELVEHTVNLAQENKIKTIYVCNMGDMISGKIHVTTRISDNLDAIEQTMKVSELITYMLFRLEAYGFDIKYTSTLDNHSRIHQSYRNHIEKESFVKIMDWYIGARIEKSNKNIEIIENTIDDNITLINVNGLNIYCVHGHLDKPNRVIEDLSLSIGIKADYVLMGHYHSLTVSEKYFSRCIVNGSLSGVGEYAKNKRYFSHPSQNFLVLSKNRDIINNIKFK